MAPQEKPKVTPVYIRSAQHTWTPALQLKSHNGKAIVAVPKYATERDMLDCSKGSKLSRFHDNQTVSLADYPNGVLPMQNVDLNGNVEDYMDMVDLPFMHEAAILYNLKLRHIKEKPYTRTGDIVVAMNPYKWHHELYTEEKRTYYSNRLIWEQSSEDPRAVMQPHVYEVSALAYKGLVTGECLDQSILVSGESGAGKTETVKICLNHIASVQRKQTSSYSRDLDRDPVVQRVVQSNPLLEAFGNAMTRRNDNSSRFGKYLQLQFQKGGLVGSKCDVYLLEKNRVIAHDREERNFHIFYQLLAAPDSEKARFWEGLRGTTNESFRYVGPTKTSVIEGLGDGDRFQETVKCLSLVGVHGDDLTTLMKAMCIVLQLGNVGFKAPSGDADKSTVATSEELDKLSSLMGVSRHDLELSFTERTFSTDKETHKVPLNAASAQEACDALAKEVYQKSFLWLVQTINEATCANANVENPHGIIGLLDIFGFEVFPQNRFEQLCINYANEKLQQKFTEDIFKNVQEEYKAEGISLKDIIYDDNTDVLNLIEGRIGLINLLNEECIRPKGNDFDFVQKALQMNKKSPPLVVHRTDRMSFGIRHYAGEVMYDVEGFVDRNKDTLTTDLYSCVAKCSNSIISAPRTELEVAPKKKIGSRWGQKQSNIVAPTVWTKYKSQLSALMTNLRKTKSRYVRCIKPNSKKEPGLMEHDGTVEQLRCAGVVAGITIARSSFPNRLPNSLVLARFSHLWDAAAFPSKKRNGMDLTEKRRCDCMALLESALKSKEIGDIGKSTKAFAVGKTKTYFRTGALEFLESCRTTGLDGPASTIQRAARGWLARNAGQYKKQLREFEAQRESERQTALAHEAKMASEAMERHNARRRGLYDLVKQIKMLEKACDKAKRNQDKKVQKAKDRNAASRQELLDMQLRYSEVEELDSQHGKVTLVEQEFFINEHHKLISYLRAENLKARKLNAKLQDKIDKVKSQILVGEDLKESNTYQTEVALREENARALVSASLKETVSECKVLDEKVAAQQRQYMGQAKARLRLQKAVSKILVMVQQRIRDRSLVEESVILALQAEACSKSMMAALDVQALHPDLTSSDVSSSGSVCSQFS